MTNIGDIEEKIKIKSIINFISDFYLGNMKKNMTDINYDEMLRLSVELLYLQYLEETNDS